MVSVYGIVSDIHKSNPVRVRQAFHVLKESGAQKLVLNGDVIGEQNQIIPPESFLRFVLKSAADTNLETYVQFGSHEEFFQSVPILKHMAGLYGNLVNVQDNQKIKALDHDLVFLPGSDINAGGEFTFGTDGPTNFYIITERGLIPFTDLSQYQALIQKGIARGVVAYYNLNDLEKLVTEQEKTILFCHVPRNFKQITNLEICVDMAEFGQASDDFEVLTGKDRDGKERKLILYKFLERTVAEALENKGIVEVVSSDKIRKNGIVPKSLAVRFMNYGIGVPIEFKKDNRGNESLANLYQRLGITKAVSGHFHESVHRAHDRSGRIVPEKEFSPELFWMASYLDASKIGLLHVRDNLVAYQNVNF